MKLTPLLLLCTAFFVGSPAHAISYPPPVQEPVFLKEEVMTVGTKVHMFHSGTQDVVNTIKSGDVLAVYHDYPPDLSPVVKPTGKVRVIGVIGAYYFEGEVIDGFVQAGSLALKGHTACIITTRLQEKR